MSLLEFRCRLQYASGFLLEADFGSAVTSTALFGPSGSGKSSILSLIAGLRTPSSGYIRLGDTVLLDDRNGINRPPEERGIGYVFQEALLFPHLSVADNLFYGWRRRAAEARAVDTDAVIRVLDLGELLSRKPGTLSGGQRQRVALGRALLRSPQLLLLDEPLASVDDGLKQQLLRHIDTVMNEWRIPTLYVTHDQAEITQLCRRVIELEQGRVVRVHDR